MKKQIESMLTPEELTLYQTRCDPLLMSIHHFDTTYEFSDSLSAWRAGNEGIRLLREEIEKSDYSDDDKAVMYKALVEVISDEYLERFPQVKANIEKNKAKGWLGVAVRSISYEEATRAILLKRYVSNLHKLIGNMDTALVWSPAFDDNPGLFRSKSTISDESQALVNTITRLFTTKDFEVLSKIEQLITFPTDMDTGRINLYMTLSDFLVTYERMAPGEVIIVDEKNHIFDRKLVTVDSVSFMLFDTPPNQLQLSFALKRDGDSYTIN